MRLPILPLLMVLTVVPGLHTKLATAEQPPASYPLSLPSCAQPALEEALNAAGCAQGDENCICSKHKLLSQLMAETTQVCNKDDQEAVQSFASTYCGVSSINTAPAAIGTTTKAYAGLPSMIYSTQTTEPSSGFIGRGPTADMPLGGTTTGSHNGQHTAMSSGSTTTHEGGAMETGLGAAAVGAAVAAMGWVFAEL